LDFGIWNLATGIATHLSGARNDISGVSLRGAPIHRGDEAISEGLLTKEIATLRIRSSLNDKQNWSGTSPTLNKPKYQNPNDN
jgi:hypothetical protein